MTPVEKISLRCVVGLIEESMRIIDNADALIEVDSTKDLLLTAHTILSKIVGEQE